MTEERIGENKKQMLFIVTEKPDKIYEVIKGCTNHKNNGSDNF